MILVLLLIASSLAVHRHAGPANKRTTVYTRLPPEGALRF